MSENTAARDKFRWAILTLISVSHIIGATAQYGINTLAPFYQEELGLSRAQVGLFFSAFYLAMTGASFGAGWLADRLGIRKTTLQGHVALGACTVAASMAPSFAWAFASFFLAGLGYSFLNPASTKGVMVWFDRDERATAMGIKQTGVPAGGFVVALLAAPLVLVIGWRGALAALGIINCFFGFVFSSLWRDPEDRRHGCGDAASFCAGGSRTIECLELPAGELWDCNLSRRTDGANHLSPALPQGSDGILSLLGQSSAGDHAGGRDVWTGRLGCGQRPALCRAKKNRSAYHRHHGFSAIGGIEFHESAITTLFALAGGISFGSLSRRISRRVLRLDRRAGWKSQNRRGFGAYDHHQRRRRYSRDATVRLYRGQERILCDCLAGACGRRRSGLRGARRISQRAATPGRTFP